MATPLTLDSAYRDDGTFVLVVAGEIDMSNVEAFSEGLTAAIAECGGSGDNLTVDLSAVKYLDSTAISALFSRAGRIDIVAHPHLMGVFRVSGLTELVSIEAASLSTESGPD
ncbi:STAS domain-containing protein [Mycolicibacterium mucogenicum]|uniref:STAS domain-containing protein n=1 Tax=Mycolicibacterium TaxID=1866885 RepID=UPI00226A0548|nr:MULTISPECIES: STAS domain-containing protein [Mycolicibacterium]MCX8565206.1 STAS domain-containing protein [Mycolicibacterium mucogenicum]